MATLTEPRQLGRDVAATVERLSREYPAADRPANLSVNFLLAWFDGLGEPLPVSIVMAVRDRWVRERLAADFME